MRVSRSCLAVAVALLLAGCAGRERLVVAAPTPPPPVELAAPLPPGASPGMLVPQPLADGSFPTPNRQLSEAGALWHLRTGLNVAALSCPGADGAAIRAGYNRWLDTDRTPLAHAVSAYRTQYDVVTPTGRDAYDDAMTRLYNFWSQTPVRPGFCAAAAAIVAGMAQDDPATQPAVAAAALARLDAPFIAFYRAYDAWRRGAASRPVIAAVAPATPLAAPVATAAPRRPALVLDLAALPPDTGVSGAR